MLIAKYELLKDLPHLPKGAIFEHREYDFKHPDWGNPGCGCLILGWINGNCQSGWCGETYIFPGQLIKEKEWFKKIVSYDERQSLLAEIESLRKRVEEF